MESLRALDLSLVILVQNLGAWLALPMTWFTELGNEAFYIIIGPGIFWCLNTGLGLRVALMVMFSDGLNQTLKLAFHTPRPYWVSTQVKALSTETSFGLPSGHAQDSLVMWGTIAGGIRKRWVSVAIVTLVFLIGFSRVYLGVHFASDVLGGWFVGGVLLWLAGRYEARALAWLRRLPVFGQAGFALAVSLALLLASGLFRAGLSGWALPIEWVLNSAAANSEAEPIQPLALSGAVTVCGAFLGLAWGAIWTWQRGGFEVDGPWWQRLLRFLVGLAGVLVLWLGLGALFPRGETWLPYLLRYLRYAAIGMWITGLAPLLFFRLSLAHPPPQ
ncbi:MAG: phosphatase PAP2 family protein [Anaerolineales bacterium]|nr:phosphatase PAP2 family protein [Anaerolineales bacterium]